ncbi:MAG: ABC transporter permease, partial [Eubacterium sp.]|nr:ABC transporter permease [Eubacterium sp.]
GMHATSFRANRFIRWVSLLPIMIPEVILGMVYLAVFSLFDLPFGMVTLVIAHTTFCVPYVLLIVSGRLAGMNPNMVRAARDLGATPFEAFWDVTFPGILPGILSGVMLSFAMSFDDVVISVFVTGPGVSTLPLQIYTRLKTGVTPEINALATVLILAVAVGVLTVNLVIPSKPEDDVNN